MDQTAIVVYAAQQRLLAELPERLRVDGYEPHTAQARRQFRWALGERRPAAVVLGDLPTLPGTLTVLRELRGQASCDWAGVDPELPVLVVSAQTGELCELAAFEAGVDDFQPADAPYLVLRARLAALIARSQISRRGVRLAVGALRIDSARLGASYAGRPLALSRLEFRLLHKLAREPQRVHTKVELLTQVWGYPSAATSASRTVDQHVLRLRRKLAAAGAEGAIENRRGVGYRLGLGDHDPATPA